jgi:hypothetical protein
MKKGSYYNEEIDNKALFGSILIIAAGAGLILGALLPWVNLITDGKKSLSGFDGVGKYTALIALPLIAAGVYRIKSPNRVAGIVAIILGYLATDIGISKLMDTGSIIGDAPYDSFTVGFGLYLTVLAGLTGIVGGVVKVLFAKVE